MGKRILAWVMLVGFVLLIVNMVTVQFLMGPCIMVYVIIVAWFLLNNKKMPGDNKKSINNKKI